MFGHADKKGASKSSATRLAEVLACFCRGVHVSEALAYALKQLVLEAGCSGGYYALIDEQDSSRLVTQACYATGHEIPFPTELSVSESFSGQVLTTASPIAVSVSSHAKELHDEIGEGVKSALVVPLPGVGMPSAINGLPPLLGCITLVSLATADAFPPRVVEICEAFAGAMALAAANDRLEQFRRRTIVDALQRISTYLEAKDPRTAGHAERVGKLALGLGQRLGVDIETLLDLQIASNLMDIGTVAIPDAISKKPAALTAEEFAVVASHPIVSFDICQSLALPERIQMLVRNHHERLDGTGYPDKLRSSEIPLALRILSVADAFDAMQCARYHREGLTEDEALRQITLEAGVKFDPVVVQSLRDIVEGTGGKSARREAA